MADVSQIKLPDGNTYNIKDDGASTATNWVNGSATNSVRTTGSATEGSSYTMGTYAIAEGNGTKASGYSSHAEGASTTVSGNVAHAEGGGTTASGATSHAEGSGSTASGISSHAEGSSTIASGNSSHAEGGGSQATGNYSYASGFYTIANHLAQHVFGQFNIADDSTATVSTKGNYIEIVGNGIGTSSRSNARTLDWSGNEVLAGKLTVGVAGTNSMDVATVGQIPTVPSNIVNTITTTAGAHTAISNQTGNVSFNVPTNTSHLTNDSGFISTEGDPVFTAHPAYYVTYNRLSAWDNKLDGFITTDEDSFSISLSGNGTTTMGLYTTFTYGNYATNPLTIICDTTANTFETKIYGIPTPTQNDMAVNKAYVDNNTSKVQIVRW